MFKATIQNVEKRDDEIIIKVEFSDGEKSFEKDYPFVHMVDIDTNFEDTVQMELKRINDLEIGYAILKAKEGKEIIYKTK